MESSNGPQMKVVPARGRAMKVVPVRVRAMKVVLVRVHAMKRGGRVEAGLLAEDGPRAKVDHATAMKIKLAAR